jgi:hypothetical protein
VPSPEDQSTTNAIVHLQDLVLSIDPKDTRQTWSKAEALRLTSDVAEMRWLLLQPSVSSIPGPLLVGVVTWLAIVFASFGLFAPRNLPAAIVLLVCTFAVAGAIEMILDMDSPFGGEIRLTEEPIRVRTEPLRHALEVISQTGGHL